MDTPCGECCHPVGIVCAEILGCAVWPHGGMSFTVAGLVNNADCYSCCSFDPPGTAACLNRAWNPALQPTGLIPSGCGCWAVYKQVCDGTLTTDIPFGTDASAGSVEVSFCFDNVENVVNIF